MSTQTIESLPPPPFDSDCVAMIQRPCNMIEILIFQAENINNIYTYNMMTCKYNQIDNTKTNYHVSLIETFRLRYVKVLKTTKPHLIILFGSLDNRYNSFYNVFNCKTLKWQNMDTDINHAICTGKFTNFLHHQGCQVLSHKGYIFVTGGFGSQLKSVTVIKMDNETQYPLQRENAADSSIKYDSLLQNVDYGQENGKCYMKKFPHVLPRDYYSHCMVVVPKKMQNIAIVSCENEKDNKDIDDKKEIKTKTEEIEREEIELEVTLLLFGGIMQKLENSFCEVLIKIGKNFQVTCTVNGNPSRYTDSVNFNDVNLKNFLMEKYFPSDYYTVRVPRIHYDNNSSGNKHNFANIVTDLKTNDEDDGGINNINNSSNCSDCLLLIGESLYKRSYDSTYNGRFHEIWYFDFNRNIWNVSNERLVIKEKDKEIEIGFSSNGANFSHVGLLIRDSDKSEFDRAFYLMDSGKRESDVPQRKRKKKWLNKNKMFVKIMLDNGIEWKQARIIWIAFYKNQENDKCYWNHIPKVIVQLVLSFVKGCNSIF